MWKILYHKEALVELKKLDKSQRMEVVKKIKQVAKNPLPRSEDGYGDPLGSKGGTKLSGYFKIKFLKSGLRVVYKVFRKNNAMKIIVVSAREDDEVYQIARKRRQKG